MMIYAGIDEAGYGPLLGPLVITRAVFTLELDCANPFPCLWSTLRGTLCRGPSVPEGRIRIADSKELYSPAQGLRLLERGVLSLLHLLGEQPRSLQSLLDSLGFDEDSRRCRSPWYADEEGGPRLPVHLDKRSLEGARRKIELGARKKRVGLADASVAVVFEDRFNDLVGKTGSKASCAWQFVAGHLRAIWERYAGESPVVVVDRQSGRRYYGELLSAAVPEAECVALSEEAAASRYRLCAPRGRQMEVVFEVESEKRHLPTAFASMLAKYVRELWMARFRGYWAALAPQVRPTYGYFGDGRRFLQDLAPVLRELAIRPDALARRC
jgi:hypothetical protein